MIWLVHWMYLVGQAVLALNSVEIWPYTGFVCLHILTKWYEDNLPMLTVSSITL